MHHNFIPSQINTGNDIFLTYSECTFNELTILFDEPTIAATIMTEWTSLARRLETPLPTVAKHRQSLLLGLLTHSDVVEKLLVDWASRTSKEATLGTLRNKTPDTLKLLKGKFLC